MARFRFGKWVMLGLLAMGLSPGITMADQADDADVELPAGAIVSSWPVYFEKVRGYMARPVLPGPHPAVVLIHEWWGLNDDIRTKARAFADAGYVALAVDLYGGRNTTDRKRARELASSVRADMDGAFANLKAAFDLLRADAEVDADRMASVGWCFGGGWSYQVARNNLGARASVIYYGAFNPADDLSQMRASILGHFAERDRSIALDNVREFQVKLKSLSGEHAIYIYPNTLHGFANPDSKAFNPIATNRAWSRTLEFLREQL